MIKNKERANFSIDKEILKNFRIICDKKSINMSKLIQKIMTEFIHENQIN
jgi:hypothetical protein